MGMGPARYCSALMREFEEGRPVSETLGDRYCTPAGDPYLTFQGLGGIHAASAAFAAYAKNRKGMLYWRVLPEIRTLGRRTEDGETFYFRLFIEP